MTDNEAISRRTNALPEAARLRVLRAMAQAVHGWEHMQIQNGAVRRPIHKRELMTVVLVAQEVALVVEMHNAGVRG